MTFWIDIRSRKPTEADGDKWGVVLKIHSDGSVGRYPWDQIASIVAWAPIPKFEQIDPPTGYEIVPHEGYEWQVRDMIYRDGGWKFMANANLPWTLDPTDLVARPIKPKSRPFRNADEFRPFRDRWWRYKASDMLYPPQPYDDNGTDGLDWEEAHDHRLFDDGSPFGIVE
jgi:hypothetical protein